MSDADLPLGDLVILDFTRVLAGPFATALLADLGARVIKIESPGGDDYRHVGPFRDEESALFAYANRGKESLVLDLKRPDDLVFAQALAAEADVVVENFRPGVAERLGIGAKALRAANPRLVYASVSGFGQAGPLADRPAYDIIVQAMSGLMSITGEPEGAPTLVGEAFGDLIAGLFASWAILAALHRRQATGEGGEIDVAMFDCLLAMMPTATCRFFATGQVPRRVGNRHPLSAPFGAFRTADGHAIVAVLNSRLFAQLCGAIGRPELAAEPRYATDALRLENEAPLRQAIEAWSGRLPTAEVVAQLSALGVPAAPIDDVGAAATSAQAAARGLFRPPQEGRLPVPLPEQPVAFAGLARGRPVAAPALDEHGAAVRADLAAGRLRRRSG